MLLPFTAKTPSVCRKAVSRVCCASRQCGPVSMRAMRSFGGPAEAGEWNRRTTVQRAVRSSNTAHTTFNMILYSRSDTLIALAID